jgi:hypothetical protein
MREARTEHDLAEALATLERYAPGPDDVLRAVRDGSRRPLAWRRRRWLILPAAAAVAAAVALAVVLLPGAGGRPAPSRLPAAASVAKAMLTAFDTVSGDVEYETQTGTVHGAVTDVYRNWSWPVQPVPGQRQLERTLFSGRSPASPAVKLTEDRGVDLIVPPAGVGIVRGQVTMVCFLGSGQTGCGYGPNNTRPGTWSRYTAQVVASTDVGAGGLFNPAALVRGIAGGAWRVVGRTTLEGQQAIELSETGHGTDIIEPLPVLLWVNARTYLPIRMVVGTANASASTGMSVEEFRYLPPTAASLALLRVPIPPGYPQR